MKYLYQFFSLIFVLLLITACGNNFSPSSEGKGDSGKFVEQSEAKYLSDFETDNGNILGCTSNTPYETSNIYENHRGSRYMTPDYPLSRCFNMQLSINPDIEFCFAYKAIYLGPYIKGANTCFTYFAKLENDIDICDNIDYPSNCKAIVSNDTEYCYDHLSYYDNGDPNYTSVIDCLNDVALHNGNHLACLGIDKDMAEEGWEWTQNRCLGKAAYIPGEGLSVDHICNLMTNENSREDCLRGKTDTSYNSTINPYSWAP